MGASPRLTQDTLPPIGLDAGNGDDGPRWISVAMILLKSRPTAARFAPDEIDSEPVRYNTLRVEPETFGNGA